MDEKKDLELELIVINKRLIIAKKTTIENFELQITKEQDKIKK